MKVPEPIITDLTPLNHRTTARWVRCETSGGHRYSWDCTIRRDFDGESVDSRYCLRCKVPEPSEITRWNTTIAAKSASIRRGVKAALAARSAA